MSAPQDEPIAVLLCADRRYLSGLHVTMRTALEQASRPLRIHLLHDGLDAGDLARLVQTCAGTGRRFEFLPQTAALAPFKDLPSFFGGRMTYARLLAGTQCSEQRLVYLDPDLLVRADLAELADTELGGHVLAAVPSGPVESAYDGALLMRLGARAGTPVFNTGVMLIDGEAWRSQRILQRCLDVARRCGSALRGADQTLLNGVLMGAFAQLPPQFNRMCFPGDSQQDRAVPEILHYAGTPKPWDPLAAQVHRHFAAWNAASQRTALPLKLGQQLTLWKAARLARIAPALLRLALRDRPQDRAPSAPVS